MSLRCLNCLSEDLTEFLCGCQVCVFCNSRWLCAYHFATEIDEVVTPILDVEKYQPTLDSIYEGLGIPHEIKNKETPS